MQRSTNPFARVPCALTSKGSHRRTAASRHRRHSPARCSCRVVAPIRDARFVDLILAVICAVNLLPALTTQNVSQHNVGSESGFRHNPDHAEDQSKMWVGGSRNGFAEPRDWKPKSGLLRSYPAPETEAPAFECAKMAANCGLFVRDWEMPVRIGLRGGGCSRDRTRLRIQILLTGKLTGYFVNSGPPQAIFVPG